MPRSVLIVDAIATNRIRLAALLETARYNVSTSMTSHDILGTVAEYDLIVFGLPDEKPGAALGMFGTSFQPANVPVLCLDGKTTPLRRLLAIRAGARDVLPSKLPDDLLLARVRGLIREGEAMRECERRRTTAASFGLSESASPFNTQAKILCVGSLGELPSQLALVTSHKIVSRSLDDCHSPECEGQTPDILIVSACSGQRALTRILPEMRDRPYQFSAPVLVLYPSDAPELAIHALAIGADEVVVDTAGAEEIELRIGKMLERSQQLNALRRSEERSYELAMTDDLTGLFNRRYADRYMMGLAAKAAGDRPNLCLLILDIDHFKRVNDTHGHLVGDAVLQGVARCLTQNMRAFDLVARYGGEEFLIALPDTPVATASVLAERLRMGISRTPISIHDELSVNVSVSIGIAAGALEVETVQQRTGTLDAADAVCPNTLLPFFEAADAALYKAKSNGRNCIEVNAV